MALLRRTHRLSACLESQGCAVFLRNRAIPHAITLVEAEFVSVSECTAECLDGLSFIPSEFDFYKLRQVMSELFAIRGYGKSKVECFIDKVDSYPRPETKRRHSALQVLSDPGQPIPDGENVDILWISVGEFVTCQHLQMYHGFFGNHLYSVTFQLREHVLDLYAYDFKREGPRDNFSSETPLRFFCHVLKPILPVLRRFAVEFVYNHLDPPVDAALALVPTTDVDFANDVTIFFEGPSDAQLRALASHPVNRRVLLCLKMGNLFRFPPKRLNGFLLGFRHPINLQIPRELEHFDGEEEPFVVNPAFRSLTVRSATMSCCLSTKMIDGIASNKSLKSMTIDCENWGIDLSHGSKVPNWLLDLFRSAILPSDNNLECLSFVTHHNYRNKPQPVELRQAAFGELAARLLCRVWDHDNRCFTSERPARNVHSVSTFRLLSKPMKSNVYWDSLLFSPALVLNCLHRVLGGRPPGIIAALAVQRINQGFLYRFATNLIPCDLSASSASAMFDILRGGLFRRGVKRHGAPQTRLQSIDEVLEADDQNRETVAHVLQSKTTE
jgi:hypothetical protein